MPAPIVAIDSFRGRPVTAGKAAVANLLLIAGYFGMAAFSLELTRSSGGIASFWMATALLLARLVYLPARQWPVPVLGCYMAGCVASALWGAGLPYAPGFAAAMMAEALVAAAMLRRLLPDGAPFDSRGGLARFALAVGIAGPLAASPLAGGLTAAAFGVPWLSGTVKWFIVHSLGTLTLAPLLFMLVHRQTRANISALHRDHKLQALALVGLATLVDVLVFGQSRLPLLFLPMLPLVVLVFRLGRLGAAIGIFLLASIASIFAALETGPISFVHGEGTLRWLYLQFYLLTCYAIVLPVAAELNRREWLTRQLGQSEAMYRLMVERSGDILLNLELDGTISHASAAISQIAGYDPATLVGRPIQDMMHPDDGAEITAALQRLFANPHEIVIFDSRAINAAGEMLWVESHIRAVLSEDGRIAGITSAVRDITQYRQTADALATAAHTDPLTGTHNRRSFDQRLASCVASAQRGRKACVGIIDLDHFKRINDNHGHPVGDAVLQSVAATLRQVLRRSDMVARIGGEEFGLLLDNLDLDGAATLCERVLAALQAQPIATQDGAIRITASLGIAPILAHDTAQTVFAAADVALYRAKADGRNCLRCAA